MPGGPIERGCAAVQRDDGRARQGAEGAGCAGPLARKSVQLYALLSHPGVCPFLFVSARAHMRMLAEWGVRVHA